jgi:hypothetical protein
MRKRKAPVLLLSAIGVLLLVVMAINSGVFAGSPGDGHDHDAPTAQAPEPTDVKEKMKSQIDTVVKEDAKPASKVPDRPTVIREKPSVYKPTPNDNQTSAQWYTDESRKPSDE